jgi:NitT/TauT family transport system substrate-binding protein
VPAINRRTALGLIGSGVAFAASRGRSNADTPPVRIAVGGADTYAEGFYATDMGFFTKAGLNIDMTSFPSGAQILTAAGGNAVDIGLSNTANLANAIAHGAPFTIIAGAGLYTAARPTVELMVPLNSPLRAAKDLVGKTIAVTALKDLTEVGARAWLRRNGVDPNSVKFVELPMAQMPAGLDRGTFDAGIVAEPFLSGVRKTLRVLGSPYDAIGSQFLIADWFSSTDYVKKNPDIIKRFVAATYETARWANANHPASGKILAKWGKMDPALFDTMTRCEYATSLDPKYIDPVLDAMYRYEAIDKHLTSADLVTKV